MNFTKGNKSVLIFMLTGLFLTIISAKLHPYHVSYTQIEYKKETQNLTFSMEVFTDDLETALKMKYKTDKLFLGSNSITPKNDSLIFEYIKDQTTILIDGVVWKGYDFLTSESHPDRTIIYFQFNDLPPFSSLTFYATILNEIFTDQQNIIEYKQKNSKHKALLTSKKTNVTWLTSQ